MRGRGCVGNTETLNGTCPGALPVRYDIHVRYINGLRADGCAGSGSRDAVREMTCRPHRG